MRHLLLLLLALAVSAPLGAMQIQNMTVISPITGQKFDVTGVPAEQGKSTTDLADLGADDDGCRHTSGPSEYDFYIAVDPFTYFSALSAEWDGRSGRFREELPPDMKDWVIKTFNSDWQLDFARVYSVTQQTMRLQGQVAPDRKDFVMPQQTIPLEKRYRYALQCYEKRGARAVVLAKIALTGAWAIRARLNVAVNSPSLDGGYEEVQDLALRKTKTGETFVLDKWLLIYRDIFNDASLTNEGYLIAGLTYFGFVLREGDRAEGDRVLQKMQDRFSKLDKPGSELLRGLVRERKRMLGEYSKMLFTATQQFILAISTEEFPRSRLPPNLMAVAECLRRLGDDETTKNLPRAYDWYLALAKMPETQPKLRDEIRTQGKAPGPDAPFQVQLGWLADRQLARLTAAQVIHPPNEISGPDKRLLNAITYERFGSSDFVNPDWRPRTDGNQQDCALMLNLIGQATMDFTFRSGAWPKTLDELWEQDVLKDRNRVNRFCCPVTGVRFLYTPMSGDVTTAAPRTVVVATAKPVPTNQGLRYGAYLANNQLVWAETPFTAGAVAR